MLNSNSIEAVNSSAFSKYFRKPLYESYCFSRIPSTIKSLLGGIWYADALPQDVMGKLASKYRNIILIFVDAFGWRFFEEYSNRYPFLSRFEKQGCVSKITSQFPSTTVAHVTTLRSGLPVHQTGIYEWFYYEPKAGGIIAPFLNCFAGDPYRRPLSEIGLANQDIFPEDSLYQDLKQAGVQSHIVQHANYTPEGFTERNYRDVRAYPFRNLDHALSLLTDSVLSADGKNYYYFYYDAIDLAAHNSGPVSKAMDKSVRIFFESIEKKFYQITSGKVKDTLMILTADHGQEAIDPAKTVYIDREAPQLKGMIAHDPKSHKALVPAGSSRDFFLHVRPEYLDEAKRLIQEKITGIGEVFTSQELFGAGVFGAEDQISVKLRERIGNLVVLPYSGQSVYWSDNGRFTETFKGHHGGMLPSEMESLFLTCEL